MTILGKCLSVDNKGRSKALSDVTYVTVSMDQRVVIGKQVAG